MMAPDAKTSSSVEEAPSTEGKAVWIGSSTPAVMFDLYEAAGGLPRGWTGEPAAEDTREHTSVLPEPPPVQDVSAQYVRVETEIAELGAELRRVKDALVSQKFVAENGYVIRVYRGPEDGLFVAACDTLQCVAEADDLEKVIEVARGQVHDMLEFLADEEMPVPPRDINEGP